ncbi:helix-turn-helix domain-containing protein [Glaciibacter superstes]|uniref:helix-turn-helix domain-containing protein n=1 Tax=Glaciibacter superstes TaxID=501023 RepID=UPI0012FC0EBB|nr:helix-turn-helix transcriptional regulator [Glaciibacter superstes]
MAITRSSQESAENTQSVRAKYLDDCLKAERWSYRLLETRTGIAKSTVASRLKGETALTFGDIEVFAQVLNRDPVELFGTMLRLTDTKKGPASEETGRPNIRPID